MLIELPSEMIAMILESLPRLEDRKNVSLLSKRCNIAFGFIESRNLEKVVVRKQTDLNELWRIKKATFLIRNLQMNKTVVTTRFFSFWTTYGTHLRSIELVSCKVSFFALVKILCECPNLNTLILNSCNERDPSEEPVTGIENVGRNLSHLSLIDNSVKTNAMILDMIIESQNIQLKSLTLSGSQFERHKIGPIPPKKHANSTRVKTVFDTVLKYLRKVTHLTDLDLSDTCIDDLYLNLICDMSTLKLNSVNFSKCTAITNGGVWTLTEAQRSLTKLYLNFCPNVTDESLVYIKTLDKLNTLYLEGCGRITDAGIQELSDLKLKSLNISKCRLITGKGLVQALCQQSKAGMTELRLKGLQLVCESKLIQVISSLPCLKYLDLRACTEGVTDKTLQSIIIGCRKLEVLQISDCYKLTDSGVTGKFVNNMEEGEDISDNVNIEEDYNGVSLQSLTNLKKLVLGSKISNEAFKFSFHFVNLFVLDLSYSCEITCEGLKHISEQNSSIEELYLQQCVNVGDAGVWHVLNNMKRLKTLFLGSSKISDETLVYLLELGKKLKRLSLALCCNVNRGLAWGLKFNMPNLVEYTPPFETVVENGVLLINTEQHGFYGVMYNSP